MFRLQKCEHRRKHHFRMKDLALVIPGERDRSGEPVSGTGSGITWILAIFESL